MSDFWKEGQSLVDQVNEGLKGTWSASLDPTRAKIESFPRDGRGEGGENGDNGWQVLAMRLPQCDWCSGR